MTAPATSRAGGPGGSSSRASSTAVGPRDGVCRPADAALAALATVRDPALDEPITTLGFLTSCTVSARGAVLAGSDQVCRPLRAAGTSRAALLSMTLGEVPTSAALDRLRQRRAELGLPAGPGAPLLIDPATGERIREEAAPLHLRRARSTR